MTSEDEKTINAAIEFTADELNLDDLEQSLQAELEAEFEGLETLEKERENINSPDHLGETILNVVWEQFINQVAGTAGQDFIKDNGGLTLDLSTEAHIQTTENFADGKIATHNTKIDYQKRYDDWQSNFVKDKNGNIITHRTRSGKEEATLVSGARKPFDADRPSGSVQRHTDMDHTVSAAEIIRDPAVNAHMTKEEQISFANSKSNLFEIDSSLNRSKGDKSMTDWLDNPNSKGQKPQDIFDISNEDEKKMCQKDAEARKEYEKRKQTGEKRSIKAGRQSQKEEFYRISGKALRTAFMTLLAAFLKEIIRQLVLWLKSAQKKLSTFIEHVKVAIKAFIGNLKGLLVNTTDSVLTTIATSIAGPVIGTIKKVITLLKQGWKSLKEAVQYLRKPENRGKPLGYLLPQIGTIVVTGLSGIGAVVLSEFIEKSLMGIPFLAAEIPLLGSPANLIGLLVGSIVCGIIGAIAINLISKHTAKQQDNDNVTRQIDKKTKIINLQDELTDVKIKKLNATKVDMVSSMIERRQVAKEIVDSAMADILSENEGLSVENDELDRMLQTHL